MKLQTMVLSQQHRHHRLILPNFQCIRIYLFNHTDTHTHTHFSVNPHRVHADDVMSGLRYMLVSEVPSQGQMDARHMQSLHKWVAILNEVL
jgi:hypothetical protein